MPQHGFIEISENGFSDWLASDTVTFKSIYQNTDMTATQQLRNTSNIDFNDSIDYYTDFNDVTASSSSSSSTSPQTSIPSDLQL